MARPAGRVAWNELSDDARNLLRCYAATGILYGHPVKGVEKLVCVL